MGSGNKSENLTVMLDKSKYLKKQPNSVHRVSFPCTIFTCPMVFRLTK